MVGEQNSGCQGLREMGGCYSMSIVSVMHDEQDPGIRGRRPHLLTSRYCGIAPRADTWMGPETVIQSQVSQKEKHMCCILTHTCGI